MTANEVRPRSGTCGSGTPCGISPTSETVVTPATPSSATAAVGTTSATIAPKVANGVRPMRSRMPMAPMPTTRDATWIAEGWVTTYSAFSIATLPSATAPARSGTWPATMFTATPVRKPIITECDTNLV